MIDLPALSFSMPMTYEGFVESQGVASIQDDTLILEYQSNDGIFGVFKSAVQRVEIPIAEISHIELHKGWFQTKLSIQVNNLSRVQDVPGQRKGQIRLYLSRRDRAIAENWVQTLQLSFSNDQMNQLLSTDQR